MLRYIVTLLVAAGLIGRLGAHDIPNDVTVQVFVKPEGQRLQLLIRVPLKAMRDINFPSAARAIWILAARRLMHDAAMVWLSNDITIYEGDRRLPAPSNGHASLVGIRQIVHRLRQCTGARHRPAASGLRPTFTGTSRCSTCCSNIRSSPTSRSFPFIPGSAGSACAWSPVLRFLPPDGAVRAFEFIGDPGLVRLDPRWHQAALRFVQSGIPPHSGRHRSPVVSALPGDSVPPVSRA